MRHVTLRDYDVTYRGPAGSKKYKDALRQIQNDLVSAMRGEAEIDSRLFALASAFNYELQVSSSRAAALNDAIDLGLAALTDKVLVASMYTPSIVTEGTAKHNPSYGVLTLDASSAVSRLPALRNSDGGLTAAPGILIELNDGSGYTTLTRDNDIYKSIDHNYGTFWMKEYPAPNTDVYLRITWPTPPSPLLNVITINPFPEEFVEVKTLQYNVLDTLTSVPGFYESGRKAMYYFQEASVSNQIVVKLQHTGAGLVNIYGSTSYPVGLQIVDAGYIDFSSTGYAVIEMAVPGDGASYVTSILADMDLNTSGGQDILDYVRIQLFNEEAVDWSSPGTAVWDSDSDTYPYTTDLTEIDVRSGSAPVSTLYAKVTLDKVAGTSPVFRALRLTYQEA